MSVSILEVINAGGYDLTIREGAEWLLAQVNEFESLVTAAEDMIEKLDDEQDRLDEIEYNKRFRDE